MQTTSSPLTRSEALYQLAADHGIPINEKCPAELISASVCLEDGTKIIGINRNAAESPDECLAHELGHCMTDSFYIPYSPFLIRAKYEIRADKWAVQQLIPFDDLCRAVGSGLRELWELAEHFSVSGQFMEKAINIYAGMGMEVPEELYAED